MVVLKCIPSWLSDYIFDSAGIYYNFIWIHFSLVSFYILLSHTDFFIFNQLRSSINNVVDKFLGMRQVTHALEKFNTFFSLKCF